MAETSTDDGVIDTMTTHHASQPPCGRHASHAKYLHATPEPVPARRSDGAPGSARRTAGLMPNHGRTSRATQVLPHFTSRISHLCWRAWRAPPDLPPGGKSASWLKMMPPTPGAEKVNTVTVGSVHHVTTM